MTIPASSQIEAFVSYARADDEFLHFVADLRSDLEKMVRLKSGRKLTIFYDKDSIEWGAAWRDELYGSIARCVVFMPVVTPSFLESENCRDEFLRFLSQARAMDAIDLLLPIVPVASRAISPSSTDEIARMTADLQYENIAEAVLEGPGSAVWRKMIDRLASRLLEALESAEAKVLAVGSGDGEGERDLAPDDEHSAAVEDDEGINDLTVGVEENVTRLADLASGIESAMGEFAEAAGTLEVEEGMTQRQLQVSILKTASQLKDPSEALGSLGAELAELTQDTDSRFRKVRRLAAESENEDIEKGLTESIEELGRQLGDLESVENVLDNLLTSMKVAEVSSGAMRRTLRPARSGITAIRDALRTMRQWGAGPNGELPTGA